MQHARSPAASLAIMWLGLVRAAAAGPPPTSLWSHVQGVGEIGDLRHVAAEWSPGDGGRLGLTATGATAGYAWAMMMAPSTGWDLARRETIEADVHNRGAVPVEVQLWAVADRGWESVADVATIAPGGRRRFASRLRATFADGTPKLDPARVIGVRVLLRNPRKDARVEVSRLVATGEVPAWTRPPGRLEVPPVEPGPPAAGRRVRYPLAGDRPPAAHGLLHLPEDWKPGQRHPVIVEYPGNIFFVAGCHSTGLPEQCAIGYGMTRGRSAIWLSLPFIDRAGAVAENGWGDPDATADACVEAVRDINARFGGDPHNVVLTGFSRGAIACGFIGLRNDTIAGLWKGFHLCQHYDGDGWNGATLEAALDRGRRFRGKAVFHTDNPEEKVRPVTEAMGVPATFVASGLGAHSTAMFLDDRESTRTLRRWFTELVGDGRPDGE